MFLNLSKMVGTGVYSTPASVLKGTGSVGLALIYWFIGFLVAADEDRARREAAKVVRRVLRLLEIKVVLDRQIGAVDPAGCVRALEHDRDGAGGPHGRRPAHG